MKALRMVLLAIAVLTVSWVQPVFAAPLPPGISDRILLTSNGVTAVDQMFPESTEAVSLLPFVVLCPPTATACVTGAAVGFLEPGSDTILSDLITNTPVGTSGDTMIQFFSHAEGAPPLVAPAGTVFLPETGELQDVTSFFFTPTSGLGLFFQSDVEAVAAPAMLWLLGSGVAALAGCAWRRRN